MVRYPLLIEQMKPTQVTNETRYCVNIELNNCKYLYNIEPLFFIQKRQQRTND